MLKTVPMPRPPGTRTQKQDPTANERVVESWWWVRPDAKRATGSSEQIVRRAARVFGGEVEVIRHETKTVTTVFTVTEPQLEVIGTCASCRRLLTSQESGKPCDVPSGLCQRSMVLGSPTWQEALSSRR